MKHTRIRIGTSKFIYLSVAVLLTAIGCIIALANQSSKVRDSSAGDFSDEYSFESYNAVEPLVDISDTIVVGIVGPTLGRQIEGENGDGNPIILQEILVEEVIRNETLKVGSRIVISSFDFERVKPVIQTELKEGQRILFMGVQLPLNRLPSIRLSGFDFIYGRYGADSSVFDLGQDGRLVPRDPEIQRVLFSDASFKAKGEEKFYFSLDRVRQLVGSSAKKGLTWDPSTPGSPPNEPYR